MICLQCMLCAMDLILMRLGADVVRRTSGRLRRRPRLNTRLPSVLRWHVMFVLCLNRLVGSWVGLLLYRPRQPRLHRSRPGTTRPWSVRPNTFRELPSRLQWTLSFRLRSVPVMRAYCRACLWDPSFFRCKRFRRGVSGSKKQYMASTEHLMPLWPKQ